MDPQAEDKDKLNKWLQKERDRHPSADSYNDKKTSQEDSQWPEWYRRARK